MREKHVVEQDRKTNKRATRERGREGDWPSRKREGERESEKSGKKGCVEEAGLEKCGEEKPGEGRTVRGWLMAEGRKKRRRDGVQKDTRVKRINELIISCGVAVRCLEGEGRATSRRTMVPISIMHVQRTISLGSAIPRQQVITITEVVNNDD